MLLYLIHDTDPYGGYFAAQSFKPDPATERRTIDEVRAVRDFPEDIWAFALSGALPVDADNSNDSTWSPWWDDAEVVWAR